VQERKGDMKIITLSTALIIGLVLFADADEVVKFKLTAEFSDKIWDEQKSTYNIKGDNNLIEGNESFDFYIPNLVKFTLGLEKTNIIRLDKNLGWELYPGSEAYQEYDLILLHMPDNKIKTIERNWLYDVRPIKGAKKINKFQCNGQIGKAVGISKQDQTDTVFITYERWTAEDTLLGAEMEGYRKRYSKVVGVPRIWAFGLLAEYFEKYNGAQIEQISNSMDSINGLPIKHIITIERSRIPEKDVNDDKPELVSVVSEKIKKNIKEKTISVMYEITSIKEKKLEDSIFELPQRCVRKTIKY
jgi:hypothetical protein